MTDLIPYREGGGCVGGWIRLIIKLSQFPSKATIEAGLSLTMILILTGASTNSTDHNLNKN